MTATPVSVYIGFAIGYFAAADLVQWAVAYLPSSEYFVNDADLAKLSGINTRQPREVEKAGSHLKVFVNRMWPEFSIQGPKSEI